MTSQTIEGLLPIPAPVHVAGAQLHILKAGQGLDTFGSFHWV
jgi:hypothetical protein